MIPPEVCYPQLSIKQELNPNHMKNDKQTEQKPKKVNSEMRKQQNRIASRNYRMSPGSQSKSRGTQLTCLVFRRKAKTQASVLTEVAPRRKHKRATARLRIATAI
jgi:hypothetical protein